MHHVQAGQSLLTPQRVSPSSVLRDTFIPGLCCISPSGKVISIPGYRAPSPLWTKIPPSPDIVLHLHFGQSYLHLRISCYVSNDAKVASLAGCSPPQLSINITQLPVTYPPLPRQKSPSSPASDSHSALYIDHCDAHISSYHST